MVKLMRKLRVRRGVFFWLRNLMSGGKKAELGSDCGQEVMPSLKAGTEA